MPTCGTRWARSNDGPQDRCPQGHCDDVGRDIAEIEFTLGVKVTIRDTEAEADRVWKAAMEHNRTPMARVEDDDTFWNGTPEQLADRLRPYVELGFRTVDLRAARAVRHRDARALHRRGRAAPLETGSRPDRGPGPGDERETRLVDRRDQCPLGGAFGCQPGTAWRPSAAVRRCRWLPSAFMTRPVGR